MRASRGGVRVPTKWRDHYRQLLLLREHLLADRQALIRDMEGTSRAYGTHLAEYATDEAERNMNLSLLSAEQDALFEIESAIRRIEGGTYGVCELSGKPIPEARLQVAPWTRFTAEARRGLEMRGLTAKPHLGELGRVEGGAEVVRPRRTAAPHVNLKRWSATDEAITGLRNRTRERRQDTC